MSEMRESRPQTQRLVLAQMMEMIEIARARAIQARQGPFRKTEPIPLFKPLSVQERTAYVRAELEKLSSEFGELSEFARAIGGVLQRMDTSSVLELEEELHALRRRWIDDVAEETGDARELEVEPSARVDAASLLIDSIRRERRKPTPQERRTLHQAYEALAHGARVSLPYKPLPLPGHGVTQTNMSITDPGEGHVLGTSTREDFMRGVYVHVEHLERGHQDRSAVESYRIPSILNVAKVRMHVGGQAPVTSFIGRPLFDSGRFHLDLWKVVHTMAAAASAMFQQGVAECKFAMERMTASQIIEFMRCLRSNVLRNPRTQYLSAAFNLNTPILDDRDGGERRVTGRREIGMLGIELVKAGGFDKVTWDGSADTYPSVPVMEQISHATAVELVHRAHEQGLLTYFSAGFRLPQIAAAVYAGVDGVGIGGAQILRYMDADTGFHGPFQPENIPAILAARDEAARSPLGRAAALLARLDFLSSQRKLTESQERLRFELFEALCRKEVEGLLESATLQAA
ncbi:MAG: hypothetical protein JXB05_30555 [Myxococcaceae bacterium]|nr:hypothetical protein [Myxococcaceae bacterium]